MGRTNGSALPGRSEPHPLRKGDNEDRSSVSGSLGDGDAAKVLDTVFVGQVVDDFGEFGFDVTR